MAVSMALAQDVKSLENATSRIMQINELLAPYIPQQDTWNPVDKSLYQPLDPYRVPVEEAQEMQLNAIKFTFIHHYNNNYFYHKYCEMRDVRPDDIKTLDDLDKIPLISDVTFKQYPSGREFARWLATMFTGDLPKIVIKGSNPTYDEVINAFNAAGMVITYSSGTSGQCTIIPRDQKTFLAAECAVAKSVASMADQADAHAHLISADHIYLLSPNPKKTNLFIGKASNLSFDLIKDGDVQYAMDREITIELLQMAMSPKKGLKGKVISFVQNRTEQKIVDRTIQWLERYDRTKDTITVSGPPFMLFSIMNTLERDGKHFDFGERGMVATGGGWKINEYARVSHVGFRKQVQDVLGIPETHCLDIYGMCEGNGFMVQCPEGHYLHTPYTYFKPLVTDDDLTPIGYGGWGRFAFLDASAQSYPGFIISGDRVRMLERCPVCNRPGPVLEPEVQRAKGEEERGCAEEVRRTLA
jgi:phenylacetate-coenzyme A ligase PaaK-like adenylate-forming protein